MIRLIKSIGTTFLHLLYPPLCLQCGESIQEEERLFCKVCLTYLTLIEPEGRCPFCFGESCKECKEPWGRVAAACDEIGPAATLLYQLKQSDSPYLAKGAGALMATQFLKMEWPFPDLIVPVPLAPTRLYERGYNQSYLLAKVVGEILDRPVVELLKRRSGDFSQGGLSKRQREALDGENFILKEGGKGKTVLLIDDLIMTGSTLRCSAEALWEGEPKAIYGLVFCKTI